MSVSVTMLAISRLSKAIIGFGVLAGTKTPSHPSPFISGYPASAMVGTEGKPWAPQRQRGRCAVERVSVRDGGSTGTAHLAGRCHAETRSDREGRRSVYARRRRRGMDRRWQRDAVLQGSTDADHPRSAPIRWMQCHAPWTQRRPSRSKTKLGAPTFMTSRMRGGVSRLKRFPPASIIQRGRCRLLCLRPVTPEIKPQAFGLGNPERAAGVS
jgi:hypothetical protein